MRTEAGYPEGGGAPILYPSVNTLTRAALRASGRQEVGLVENRWATAAGAVAGENGAYRSLRLVTLAETLCASMCEAAAVASFTGKERAGMPLLAPPRALCVTRRKRSRGASRRRELCME